MTDFAPLDRRAASREMLVLVQQVHDNQILAEQNLTKHMVDMKLEIAETVALLTKTAFPEGDPDGHRRHHELVIKAAEEKAEFWKKLRLALAQYGLLGFAGWAFYALWQAALHGPTK